MKIRPIFILAIALACSSIAFSLLGRLDSAVSSISMAILAVIDFGLILYFSTGQRYAQFKSSGQLVSLLTSFIVIFFCVVGALVG
jgi:hypothetical protein